MARDETLVLSKIKPARWYEFDHLLREARRQARAAGLKPAGVKRALARVRKRWKVD